MRSLSSIVVFRLTPFTFTFTTTVITIITTINRMISRHIAWIMAYCHSIECGSKEHLFPLFSTPSLSYKSS